MEESFGFQMQAIRKQQGLSQAEVAQRINRDHTYISKIERDVLPPPRRNVINAWLDALEITDPYQRFLCYLSSGRCNLEDVILAAKSVSNPTWEEHKEIIIILMSLNNTTIKRIAKVTSQTPFEEELCNFLLETAQTLETDGCSREEIRIRLSMLVQIAGIFFNHIVELNQLRSKLTVPELPYPKLTYD